MKTIALIASVLFASVAAQPAVSAPDEAAVLTYLARSIPAEVLAELRIAAPNLRVIEGLSRTEALKLAPEVDGIDGRYCTAEFLRAADRLRWVQSTSAGVERYIAVTELRDNDRIVLTNIQAVHGPTIAGPAFANLTALTRDPPPTPDDSTVGPPPQPRTLPTQSS